MERVRQIIRSAAIETDFYRDRFRSAGFDPAGDFSFDDLARLPVLTRDDVQNSGSRMISRAIDPAAMMGNATGGSTGKPTEIWMGPEERGWGESGIEFALENIGVPSGSRLGYLWGHHLDPQLKPNFSERIRGWALNYRFFDCFRLSDEVFAAYHERFKKYSPDCIVAYASALGYFAKYLKERGIRPENYPRVCFVTGAEKLHPDHHDAIEEVFGKPVHERYGGRDFGPAAFQRDSVSRGAFCVDWTWCFLEPETSEPDSPILITKLHADVMPMIRYRVGDVGGFPADSRPGRPVFELREVVGRQTEGIRKLDGGWLHGNQFPHLLKDLPVREFMLVQDEDLSLEVKIVRAEKFEDSDHRKILETIKANTGELGLKISYVDAIERGPANKWTPVVSKARK